MLFAWDWRYGVRKFKMEGDLIPTERVQPEKPVIYSTNQGISLILLDLDLIWSSIEALQLFLSISSPDSFNFELPRRFLSLNINTNAS